MEKDPQKYWDETDGLFIPELYFQYKFPETSFGIYNSLLPSDQQITLSKFKEILEINTSSYFEIVARHESGGDSKQIWLSESSKTLLWVALCPTIETTNKVVKSYREDDNRTCREHVKIDELTEIYSVTMITANPPLFDVQSLVSEVFESSSSVTSNLNNLVFTLGQGSTGPKLDSHYITLSTYGKDIIDSNYNDDFKDVYKIILDFLHNDDSGLVLFDGAPGTGKTSVIKHFISLCSELDKRIVIVPAAFASVLSDPSFLTFATQQLKESIILLEDAETALSSRTGNNNDSVSNILNLSDGILGDILSVKIIATINTSDSIDKALLRAGRLKAKYTFEKLKLNKVRDLAEKLNVDPNVFKEDVVLAEVYNRSPNDFSNKSEGSIGFKMNNNNEVITEDYLSITDEAVIIRPTKNIGFRN